MVLNANIGSVGHHFQGDPNHKSKGSVAHGQGVEDVWMRFFGHFKEVACGGDKLVGSGKPVLEFVTKCKIKQK